MKVLYVLLKGAFVYAYPFTDRWNEKTMVVTVSEGLRKDKNFRNYEFAVRKARPIKGPAEVTSGRIKLIMLLAKKQLFKAYIFEEEWDDKFLKKKVREFVNEWNAKNQAKAVRRYKTFILGPITPRDL